jgi:hypothetical protein
VEYTGDGATLPFAVPFKFLVKTDLVVVLRTILTGVDVVQTIYTHYTVLGAGDTSGTVTFVTAPPSTQRVVIYNDPPLTQLVDYLAGDSFPAETHEQALDRLTLQQKRTRELVERTPNLLEGDLDDGTGTFDANLNRIKNLGAPVDLTDAATKTYVAAEINNAGLSIPTGLIATGSSTSRSLADRWGSVTNVKDFGAVGDGATDDTAAILAAIAACTDEETLYMPDGIYKTTATVDFRYKHLDASTARIVGYHSDIIAILGNTWLENNGPSQNIQRVTRDVIDLDTPDVQVLGAKGQVITVDFCNYIQFYADTDGVLAEGIFYSTFWLKYANKVELTTNPSPSGSLTQFINENTFHINRAQHILVSGTYPHNHNYFHGMALEGTYDPGGGTVVPLIDCQVGRSNYFLRVRNEGILGVIFARGVTDCIVERGWVSASHHYDDENREILVNNGDMCGIRHAFDKWVPPHLLVGFDYQSLTLSGGRYNVAGVSNLTINTKNITATGTFTQIYESPMLPCIEGQNAFEFLVTGWVEGTFTAAQADNANNQIDYGTARHGYQDNYGPIRLTTTDTFPVGLATDVDYWINVVDKHKIQFLDAYAGSLVTFSTDGVGTATLNNPGIRGQLTGYDSTGAEITRTGSSPTFTSTEVTHATEQVDFGSAHQFIDSDGPVRLTTTDTLPAGLFIDTDYWINVVSSDVIQFLDAHDGAVVSITSDGAGTQTIDIRDVVYSGAPERQFGAQGSTVNYSGGRAFYVLNTSTAWVKLTVKSGGKGAAFSGFYFAARGIEVEAERGMLTTAFPTHEEKFSGTVTFTSSDATPTVATGRTFITAGSTAITDFDDGVDGQIITVRAHGAITLTDSANLQLDGNVNFVMAADDTVTLANIGGTNWYETGRSVNAQTVFTGSTTHTFGTIGGYGLSRHSVTCTGATVGMFVEVALDSQAALGVNAHKILLTGHVVTGGNSVEVVAYNFTAAGVTLASGTLSVRAYNN